MPDQSWLAVGSDPSGSIFISGHDHVGSMLYRLDETTGMLNWVGMRLPQNKLTIVYRNCREVSAVQPITTAASTLRHSTGRLSTVPSTKHVASTGVPSTRLTTHSSISAPQNPMALARNTYKLSQSHLTTRITGSTASLSLRTRCCTSTSNKPLSWGNQRVEGYFYSNRFMWTDSSRHLYFTGGTKRSQWNREDPRVLDTVWKYDPPTGFEKTDFRLKHSLRSGWPMERRAPKSLCQ